MTHQHDHGPASYHRAFGIGIALNVGFVILEAVFGLLVGSLALLADAGHNMSDVLGLLLAWGANYLMQRPATRRYTYGLRSSSILAALLNAIILLVAVGGIILEAVQRLMNPAPVPGATVIWVALVGLVINGLTALLFLRGRKRDLNIRGAFLHMAADAAVSAGVVVAGIVILLTGVLWLDPVVSLIIAAVILVTTWDLLRESINLALAAVPRDIDPREVRAYLKSLPGVEGVHDLHIWGMSTAEAALTVHLVKPDPSGDDALIAEATRELHDHFRIEHTTIQWERESRQCEACDQAEIGTLVRRETGVGPE
jgi:cobalt-zinc-cadmium efflux system protein